MTKKTSNWRNLGPQSRRWLWEIGIHTRDQIQELGAVETWLRLKFRFGRQINRNMLHALAASLLDIDWRDLSDEHKADLDQQVADKQRESG